MGQHKSVMETTRLDEEILSPETFIRLSPEQRRNILKATPLVKPIGTTALGDSGFAAIHVKWKTPKYEVLFE
ncbi:hypothetical protein [Desulfobotulus sp.]|uniref:hypothetical protein n=1 Tax=Desulfobotulus sp. TaxID=1940337 RepID=UPI002A35F5CA|nr:hypothetical protein [Desulfobotulus sp.]MDY0164832.1 hypothetical protein [Desulfobotulus sp.]